MPFDMKRFEKTKFTDRTEAVPVPDLAEWFKAGEAPEIIVRGLTGIEIAATNEAVARNKNVAGMIEAIAAINAADKIDAIKASLGIDGKAPDDIVKRVEQLKIGAVSPAFDQMQAVKFFEVFPVEAYIVTNAINRLTGKGKLSGESKPSGKTVASGQA